MYIILTGSKRVCNVWTDWTFRSQLTVYRKFHHTMFFTSRWSETGESHLFTGDQTQLNLKNRTKSLQPLCSVRTHILTSSWNQQHEVCPEGGATGHFLLFKPEWFYLLHGCHFKTTLTQLLSWTLRLCASCMLACETAVSMLAFI